MLNTDKEEFLEDSDEVLEDEKVEVVKDVKAKKNSTRVVTLMIIVLFCFFLGVGVVIGTMSTTEIIFGGSASKGANTTNGKDGFKEIEVNALIENLHNKVGFSAMRVDKDPNFDFSGKKVSEMADLLKNRIASSNFISSRVDYSSDNLTTYSENDVKYAYDSIFGVGTYKEGQNIIDFCELEDYYKYNKDQKRYEAPIPQCGGISGTAYLEKIIKAEKNNSHLKIITSVVIESINDGEAMLYRTHDDYINKTVALGSVKDVIGEEYVNTTTYSTNDKIYEYIEKNADSLQQYTYTFELDSNGFYKYIGFERTKE